MLGMTRRRNLLLWFSFASIPLAALGIVLAVALSPSEASRQIKKIQPGMTYYQVRAALGTEGVVTWEPESFPFHTYLCFDWDFRDGSSIRVTFEPPTKVVQEDWAASDSGTWGVTRSDVIRKSRPWYAGIRDTLRRAALPI